MAHSFNMHYVKIRMRMIYGTESDMLQTVLVRRSFNLLETKEQKQDLAESILEEIRLLEEDIALRSSCIKDLVRQL